MNENVITGGHCKDKLADSKVKMLKVMNNWELSGNGEGNRNLVDEDAEWITLDSTDANFGAYTRNQYKDDNRKDFLSQFGPEILYAWKLFDINEIRQSVLSTLDGTQAATVDGVPETEVTR